MSLFSACFVTRDFLTCTITPAAARSRISNVTVAAVEYSGITGVGVGVADGRADVVAYGVGDAVGCGELVGVGDGKAVSNGVGEGVGVGYGDGVGEGVGVGCGFESAYSVWRTFVMVLTARLRDSPARFQYTGLDTL